MTVQEERQRKSLWSRETYWHLLVLLGVIALSVFIFINRESLGRLETYKDLGYFGIFLIDLLSSASIVIPLPGAFAVYLGGSFLNPFIVALVAGVAEPLGELTGYAAGYGGRTFMERNEMYIRLEGWMQRRGSLTIFIVSVIPNFLFDIVGFAAGALRFPVWKFLLVCWAGKTIKSLGFALLGYYSLDLLIQIFRIFPWLDLVSIPGVA
ncbi:MAG: VTT domain-containing protein [Chloroflexi bacterium]|nr:VTT domain-containing protein [Chloroflexota bacterium]